MSMWHRHISHLWRLFFLQSSRNERTVDGLGFFHAIVPEAARWAADDKKLKDIARRHMGYFNANPILASYILGAVLNMERRKLQGEEISDASIERVKSTLSAVLTAKGDYFFEVVLIPLGLTIACIFAMYRSYFGPIIFLVLYNYYHLQARIGGYLMGVRMGEGVGRVLVKHIFREQGFLGGCAAFASGVLAALTFVRAYTFGNLRLAGWGVAVLIAAFLLRGKLSVVLTVIVVFVASAVYLLLI
jgi:mannose/fructose/N-acetylgalactosamine-specific phosphotransferase system component IID